MLLVDEFGSTVRVVGTAVAVQCRFKDVTKQVQTIKEFNVADEEKCALESGKLGIARGEETILFLVGNEIWKVFGAVVIVSRIKRLGPEPLSSEYGRERHNNRACRLSAFGFFREMTIRKMLPYSPQDRVRQ